MSLLIYIFLLLLWLFTGSAIDTTPKNKKTQLLVNNQDTVISDCPTFTPVQKQPKFPGGISSWRKYLEHRLKYPQAAIDNNIEAVIKVQMAVQVDGRVTNVQSLNDPSYGLGDEAVRVIKMSPKWKPAIKNGRPVIYRFVQTVTFKL